MDKNLLILGAGGHGRVVRETAVAMDYFNRVDFLDDNSELAIGKCKDFKKFINEYLYAFIAFGDNEQRMWWVKELIELEIQIPILIHPTAYVSPSANIGIGSIVCPKAVINTNVRVEKGCIISIGALVDHDSYIGECSHINVGAVVKAGSRVERLKKVAAGMVHLNQKTLDEYSFEVGV